MTRQTRAERRRDQILEAAYRVFGEKGYHQSGIADIAAVLGIGHGTFYRYFKNKRDIFQHVVQGVVERVRSVVADEDPAATDSLEAYREQVLRIATKLGGLFRDDPYLGKLLFYEALGIDQEINELIHRAFDMFGAFTELYFQNGLRKGFLREGLPTRETALAVNAMIFEAARRIYAAEQPHEALPRWIAAIVALMFDGIRR